MPSLLYNVIIPQAADWDDGVIVNDAADGAPLDLTGYTAKLQGRTRLADGTFSPTALFTITNVSSADGVIDLAGGDGLIRWKLKASKTATLPAPAEIAWDLRIVAPDATVLRPVEGIATVSPAATLP